MIHKFTVNFKQTFNYLKILLIKMLSQHVYSLHFFSINLIKEFDLFAL